MTDDPANGSKLVARTSQRTLETLSKWAVPSLLIVVMAMGKIGYDGLTAEAAMVRTELRRMFDELAVRTTQIAILEANVEHNQKWYERTEARQEKVVKDLSEIRLILARQERSANPKPEGGSGPIPMLWHF